MVASIRRDVSCEIMKQWLTVGPTVCPVLRPPFVLLVAAKVLQLKTGSLLRPVHTDVSVLHRLAWRIRPTAFIKIRSALGSLSRDDIIT